MEEGEGEGEEEEEEEEEEGEGEEEEEEEEEAKGSPSVNHGVEAVQKTKGRHGMGWGSTVQINDDVIVHHKLVHNRKHITVKLRVHST